MISEEQREAIRKDPRYGAWEETLAIGALKRRLDFQRGTFAKYDADSYSIETEKAGCSLKIKWKFKNGVSGHKLLGFRATGGFSDDEWSETKNGARVIDANRDGEATETLEDGTAYFYTFFLKPSVETEKKYSPLRFQTTIESRKEMDTIEKILREKPSVDPIQESLTEALKAVGAYVEMDRAFEGMERSFSEDIMKSDRPQAEKRRSIERLRAAIKQIRLRYEP
jgi:hypothetical protein